MVEVWELARCLKNNARRGLLRYVCESFDGVNVSMACESTAALHQPSTSQYLSQLARLGLIERYRSGKYVSYKCSAKNAPKRIRDIALAIENRFIEERTSVTRDERYVKYLPALANAARARMIAYIFKSGRMKAEDLLDVFGFSTVTLSRHLESLKDCSLITYDETECVAMPAAVEDPIALKMIDAI